jgi:hypothetical protein
MEAVSAACLLTGRTLTLGLQLVLPDPNLRFSRVMKVTSAAGAAAGVKA